MPYLDPHQSIILSVVSVGGICPAALGASRLSESGMSTFQGQSPGRGEAAAFCVLLTWIFEVK